MISNAVGLELVSRILGYKVTKGDFSESTPNLPQRIAILAEANTANQGTLDLTPRAITTAQQAGRLYGFGSPIYHIMRILRPVSGGTIGGIPTIVYPQAAAQGSTARVLEIAVTGTATANGTHTVVVAGRRGVDGSSYDVNIQRGDTQEQIAQKIEDAINNVLGSPVTASAPDVSQPSANVVTCTTKWTGLTAQGVGIEIDTNGVDLGVTYAVTQAAAGSGTPNIMPALQAFGNEWNTIVINSYGTVDSIMDSLESFNGIPDPEVPTGRFTGIIMKPFIALTGSVAEDPSSITDARPEDVTIAICPAPKSAGLPMEAAANMCALFARVVQDTPHLDVSGMSYPDMPTPSDIGVMSNYDDRDRIVKLGCSTVDLVAGRYQVQDFVTTYHPEGEVPPQYRYCRNLMIDWNIRYGYYLREQMYVIDHAIANDNDVVSVSKVVKPKQWRQVVRDLADDYSRRGIIVDAPFMQDSIQVGISTTNPDRLETFFRYKRSGYVRIASTTAEAGFNFGSAN